MTEPRSTDTNDDRGIGKRAIAELDHFEGEFAEFAVIDPDTRRSPSGTYPYIEASEVPEDTGPGDVFNIRYDPETEKIHTLEYSEEETEKQRTRNARKLADLQEDEVVTTKDSTVPGESGERSDGEQAIAELDHFEGEYVAFTIIDPESREPKLGINPYVEAEAVPENAGRGDLFDIWYDPETEEIIALEYSEEETKKQRNRNASKLAELQEDEVVSTAEDPTEPDESGE